MGQDFSKADKGKTFKRGGDMASKMNAGFMAMMAKKKGAQEGSKADMASDKKQMMGMKKGGGVKKMAGGGLAAGNKSADGIASKGKTKGKMIKMNMGGKAC